MKTIVIIFFALLVFTAPAFGFGINLQWDASATPNVTYKVYFGKQQGGPYGGMRSDQGPSPVQSDSSLTFSLTGLDQELHYFVVTAVDSLGRESAYSNEVSFNPLAVVSPPGNLFIISVMP